MTDQADTGPIAHRREGGHWLVFNEQRAAGGPVTGCHCGFVAELDSDSGWGDSVLDHFETVVRAETAAEVRALRAENEQLSSELVTMSAQWVNTGLYGARVAKERDSALAELAAARDQIAAVTAALMQGGQTPAIRAQQALFALSQSGQPTKGEPA